MPSSIWTDRTTLKIVILSTPTTGEKYHVKTEKQRTEKKTTKILSPSRTVFHRHLSWGGDRRKQMLLSLSQWNQDANLAQTNIQSYQS